MTDTNALRGLDMGVASFAGGMTLQKGAFVSETLKTKKIMTTRKMPLSTLTRSCTSAKCAERLDAHQTSATIAEI